MIDDNYLEKMVSRGNSLRSIRKRLGKGEYTRIYRSIVNKAYQKSAKGKESRNKYYQSEKGRLRNQRYRRTLKYKTYQEAIRIVIRRHRKEIQIERDKLRKKLLKND